MFQHLEEQFPADGFQVRISTINPHWLQSDMEVLNRDVEFNKQLSVEKPIVKGYNFFKSGKVLGLYSKSENGLVSVFLNIGCTTTYKFDKF